MSLSLFVFVGLIGNFHYFNNFVKVSLQCRATTKMRQYSYSIKVYFQVRGLLIYAITRKKVCEVSIFHGELALEIPQFLHAYDGHVTFHENVLIESGEISSGEFLLIIFTLHLNSFHVILSVCYYHFLKTTSDKVLAFFDDCVTCATPIARQ